MSSRCRRPATWRRRGPTCVVFGCTSAGALRGNDYDAGLCERISELTGAPVVSTIRSVREAIEESGAASIGVIAQT